MFMTWGTLVTEGPSNLTHGFQVFTVHYYSHSLLLAD